MNGGRQEASLLYALAMAWIAVRMPARPRLLHPDRRSRIGPATANIGDGRIDVGVSRLWLRPQQRSHRHDHSTLAVTALRDVLSEPDLLHRVEFAIGTHSLNGRNLPASCCAHWQHTGADCCAVDKDRTGATLRDATAVSRSTQAKRVANDPQQWRIGVDVE